MPTQLSIMDEVLGHRTHRDTINKFVYKLIVRDTFYIWVNSSNWICWFVGSLLRLMALMA